MDATLEPEISDVDPALNAVTRSKSARVRPIGTSPDTTDTGACNSQHCIFII